MSTISRIVVQSYEYQIDDFGPNMGTYVPDVPAKFEKFIVTIETDDGLSGSYAPTSAQPAMPLPR